MPDEMRESSAQPPSETLRAAAARLRELAAKATPGPWLSLDSGDRLIHVIGERGDFEYVVDEPVSNGHNAAWIATLSPVVAEPLAAWLESEAACQDSIAGLAVHLPKLIDSIAGEPLGAALRVTVDAGPQALAFAHSILEQP